MGYYTEDAYEDIVKEIEKNCGGTPYGIRHIVKMMTEKELDNQTITPHRMEELKIRLKLIS